MASFLDKLSERLCSMLGLDFEFGISLRRDPISQITPWLYLGARPEPGQLDALKAAGITHVVSCLKQEEHPKVAFLQEDFDALFLPVHDGIHQDLSSWFCEFFDFAQGAPRLFVHCEVGVSRSATLVTALVMRSRQLRFYEAFLEVRSQRPEVLPNIGFATQLQRLEHQHHPERECSSLALYLRHICNAPVDLELLQTMLKQHGYDALEAIQAIFGDDIPRVIQGVRL